MHVLLFLQLISLWLKVVGGTRGGGWKGTEKLQKHLMEYITFWLEMSSADLEAEFTSTERDTGALTVPAQTATPRGLLLLDLPEERK